MTWDLCRSAHLLVLLFFVLADVWFLQVFLRARPWRAPTEGTNTLYRRRAGVVTAN